LDAVSAISILISILLIVSAIISLELKDLIHAIIALGCFSSVLAVAFFLLSAPYVGVFQLAVLTGAVTVLFLIAVMLTSKREEVN